MPFQKIQTLPLNNKCIRFSTRLQSYLEDFSFFFLHNICRLIKNLKLFGNLGTYSWTFLKISMTLSSY